MNTRRAMSVNVTHTKSLDVSSISWTLMGTSRTSSGMPIDTYLIRRDATTERLVRVVAGVALDDLDDCRRRNAHGVNVIGGSFSTLGKLSAHPVLPGFHVAGQVFIDVSE